MPIATMKPLNQYGKANKVAILLPLVLEEIRKGVKHLDRKKLLLIASKRLEQFPAHQRAGVKFTSTDWGFAIRLANKARREEKPAQQNFPPAANGNAGGNGEVSYSRGQISLAKEFLKGCGGSLSQAKEILDLFYI